MNKNSFGEYLLRIYNSKWGDEGVSTSTEVNLIMAAKWFMQWPPDAFLLTSQILKNTGAYIHVLSPPDKQEPLINLTDSTEKNGWYKDTKRYAFLWKLFLVDESSINVKALLSSFLSCGESEIDNNFKKFFEVDIDSLYNCRSQLPEEELSPSWELLSFIIKIHAIADEFCRGIGILSTDGDIIESDFKQTGINKNFNKFVNDIDNVDINKQISAFEILQFQANYLLTIKGSLSRLPKHIGVILPKSRTPQYGTTLRSFSFNLTYHNTEADILWRTIPWNNPEEHSINIMIVPWPFDVNANDFEPVYHSNNKVQSGDDRYFKFADRNHFDEVAFDNLLKLVVERLILMNSTEVKRIHFLVFPEGSLSYKQFKKLQLILEASLNYNQLPIIIAGITGEYETEEEDVKLKPYYFQYTENKNSSFNNVVFSINFAGHWYEQLQGKHHRWYLDNNQINQYELAGVLTGGKIWWEHINIRRRTISFFSITPWLTLAPLICEDLARLEPVAEIIRGVGPNLLIAVLFDGPQLKQRWPGRYASIFADDPGSSVLTVTALGMVQRSNKIHKKIDESGGYSAETVALWKDQLEGFKEVSITNQTKLPILKLNAVWLDEVTADTRKDFENSSVFTIAGIDQNQFKNNLINFQADSRNISFNLQNINRGIHSINHPNKYILGTTNKWLASLDFYELSIYNYFIDAILDIYLGAASDPTSLKEHLEIVLNLASLINPINKNLFYDESLFELVKYNTIHREYIPYGFPSIQLLYSLERAVAIIQGLKPKPNEVEAIYHLQDELQIRIKERNDDDNKLKQFGEQILCIQKSVKNMFIISTMLTPKVKSENDSSTLIQKYPQKRIISNSNPSDFDDSEFHIFKFYEHFKELNFEGDIADCDIVKKVIFQNNLNRLENSFYIALFSAIHNRYTIKRRKGILSKHDANRLNELDKYFKSPMVF